MNRLLIIGVGGFVGAVLRYVLGGAVQGWSKSVGFPYGTLAVNVLGCVLIGLLSYLADTRTVIPPELRSFLLIGILGAFTTFSTFGNETMNLLRAGENLASLANVSAHLVLGLGGVWMGRQLAQALWR